MASDNEDEVSYLTINHRNSLREIDEEAERFHTLELFTTLSSIDEDMIGKSINTFFNRILPENEASNDILLICQAIASKEKLSKETIHKSYDNILNKNLTIDFTFNRNDVFDLFNALITLYQIIKAKYSSIQTFQEFLALCKAFSMSNTKKNILKEFTVTTTIQEPFNDGLNTQHTSHGNSPIMNERRKSSSNSNKTNKSNNAQLQCRIDKQLYTYKYKEIQDSEYTLPIEAMILISKFETVRRLKFNLKEVDSTIIRPYIMIFFNLEWIFQNAFDVDVDLSHENIYRDMERYYSTKMLEIANKSRKMMKNTNYNTGHKTQRLWNPSYESKIFQKASYEDEEDEIIIDDGNCEEDDEFNMSLIVKEYADLCQQKHGNVRILSYQEIISKYSGVFELHIIYSYFLSQMKNVYVMSIILPDCFKLEVINCLKAKGIYLLNYHFFSFIHTYSSLLQLTCDINCLDCSTIEKLIGLIYKNQKLTTLHLSLFPPEEYFSPEMLLKLLNTLGYNYHSVFPQKHSKINTDGNINEEMDTLIINKLLDSFESNIQSLFSLIEQKQTLTEFFLLIDLPALIYNNENYTMVLLKLFFNLFIYLQNGNCNFETLKILSPYFRFDNRKYPILSTFCDRIDLYRCKTCKVKRFTLQVTFFNLCNLYKIIPLNVKVLILGDLDYDTLKCLIEYFTSRDYKKNNKPALTTLKLSLSKTITSYGTISKLFRKLLTMYPKSLKEIHLFTWINIRDYEINGLLEEINYNSLEKCQFEFCKKGDTLEDEPMKLKNCYYLVHSNKMIWRLLRVMNQLSKINKSFMNKKTFDLLNRFISKREKKELFITYKNNM